MMDKIRIDRYIGRFIILCWLTFVVCACSNEPELPAVVKGQITIGEVKASEEKNAPELFYTVCLFRSPGQGDEYTCQKIDFCTQEGIKRYSFKIDNLDMGKYKYRLFVHATPENSETKVVGIAAATETTVGTVYDDIEVELVERDGAYVPLSKDNYAGKQDISVEQILSGNTSLKLQLQRFVGQLLFDVFKCNESKIPEDIEMTYASTLDRVKHIDLMVTGMTTRLKLSDGSVMKASEATTRWMTTTTLEAVNYQLNIEKQDQQYIRQAEKQNAAGEPWNPRGATRLLTAYLLPTGDDGKELLKANLSFTYWDTTLASGKYDERELMLKMPSSGQKLKVMKNCYTLTNIRLTHNRIIDLSAGGDATIDTGWDK